MEEQDLESMVEKLTLQLEEERKGREEERKGREEERKGREKAEKGREKERKGREEAVAKYELVSINQMMNSWNALGKRETKTSYTRTLDKLLFVEKSEKKIGEFCHHLKRFSIENKSTVHIPTILEGTKEMDLYDGIANYFDKFCETFDCCVVSQFNVEPRDARNIRPDGFILHRDDIDQQKGKRPIGTLKKHLIGIEVKQEFETTTEKAAFQQLVQLCFSRDVPTGPLGSHFPWFGIAIDRKSVFGVEIHHDEKLEKQVQAQQDTTGAHRFPLRVQRTMTYSLSEKESTQLVDTIFAASIHARGMKAQAAPGFISLSLPPFDSPPMVERFIPNLLYIMAIVKKSDIGLYLVKISQGLSTRLGLDDQVKREITALRELNKRNCPCIPQMIYGGEYLSDWNAIVTQPVGIPLDQMMPLPLRSELIELISHDIMEALMAIHRCGILHADVCPANIILVNLEDGRQEARLIDFGASVEIDDNHGSAGHLETSSRAQMMGESLTSLDDFESYIFTIRWISNSTLPWLQCDFFEVLRLKQECLQNLTDLRFLPESYHNRSIQTEDKLIIDPTILEPWVRAFHAPPMIDT